MDLFLDFMNDVLEVVEEKRMKDHYSSVVVALERAYPTS